MRGFLLGRIRAAGPVTSHVSPHTATNMRAYDPDRTPDPKLWLGLDEQLRMVLVEAHHKAANVKLPNVKAHAAFHAIIENQVAMQHPPVVRAMARLAKQGLSRHDCIHAIAWVLVQHFHETATSPEPAAASSTLGARYDAAVERLTAAEWRAQAVE